MIDENLVKEILEVYHKFDDEMGFDEEGNTGMLTKIYFDEKYIREATKDISEIKKMLNIT